MKIVGVEHVSINVKDMAASVKFYRDVLGLRQLETVPMDGFAITYFQIPDGRRLELFDYAGRNHQAERHDEDVGWRHVAFTVDDVAAAEKELRAKGVPITLPMLDLPMLRVRVCLFLDPSGVTLEFCQPLN